MISKRDAKRLAETGALSVGALRGMIESARGRRSTSRVNPTIPYSHVLDIYAGALAGRDPSENMTGLKADPYTGRLKQSKDCRIALNILVDCCMSLADATPKDPNHV